MRRVLAHIVPDRVRCLVPCLPASNWQAFEAASGAGVYQVPAADGRRLFLKVDRGDAAVPLSDEWQVLTWLQGWRRAALPVAFARIAGREYLWSGALPGRDGRATARAGALDAGALVDQVALALRDLHELPAAPFQERFGNAAWLCTGACAGAPEAPRGARLRGRYRCGSARCAVESRRSVPPPDVVVTHGDLGLSNVIVEPSGAAGFVDMGLMALGDRYLDVASVLRSLRRHLGDGWETRFVERYGLRRPAWDRVERHSAAYFAREASVGCLISAPSEVPGAAPSPPPGTPRFAPSPPGCARRGS